MTITVSTNSVTWLGTGATSVFSYPFAMPSGSDATLLYTTAAGLQTTIAPGNYTMTGVGQPTAGGGPQGGTVTYAPGGVPIPAGSLLTLIRTVPDTQPNSFTNQGGLWPSTVEASDDNLEMQIQQIQNLANRAIVVNPADLALPLPLPPAAARANQNAIFDSNGNLTSGLAVSGSANVSSALQPVVDAASLASAARLLGTMQVWTPEQYGATGGGAHDDGPAINNAIAAAGAYPGGGIVYCSQALYGIATPIVMNLSNVKLIGGGRGGNHDTNPVVTAGTTFLWLGANGGTMISVASTVGGQRLVGWAVEEIALVSGNYPYTSAAAIGVLLSSCAYGKLRVTTIEFTATSVATTGVASLAENSLCQFNDIDIVARQINTAGTVLQLGGYPNVNNSCFNRIWITAEYNNGIGIDIQDGDNNTFYEVYLQLAGGGTGTPLYLRGGTAITPGYARNNIFVHYSQSVSGGQIFSEGVGTFGSRVVIQPAVQNQIIFFDQSNEGFSLFEGTNSTFWTGKNTLPLGQSDLYIGTNTGYRADIAGLYDIWGVTGPLAGSTSYNVFFPNGLSLPNGLFLGAFASGANTAEYSITNPSATGFTLYVGPYPAGGTAIWYWRAMGR